MAQEKRGDSIPADLSSVIEEWAEELDLLRQNHLLSESQFLSFAKDRGIRAWGVVSGDPSKLHDLGWLARDGVDGDGAPLFHPFRIYPLHCVLKACALEIAPSSTIHRDRMPAFVKTVLSRLPTLDDIEAAALRWNRMTDLPIILEPVYWPRVTGTWWRSAFVEEDEFRALLERHHNRALELVAGLDVEHWRGVHESLRIDAARMDDNGGLYLLLRLSPWSKRQRLNGAISGALWFRHIAETIRRAFEEAHSVQWPEEDQSFGHWFPEARSRAYGSDRPLDDLLASRPYLAWEFGLFTGSVVRWYVEGETEFYAIREVLPDASKIGIELVNLRGNIEGEYSNSALKLADGLRQDQALRRFSFISFDTDVPANVRAVRQQVKQRNVVGFIAAHKPDFEFANFTLGELVEIAARLDEEHKVSGDRLRRGDWSGVENGRDFEKRYKELSERGPRGLKGEKWGAAMAAYADEHPNRSDNESERPFWRAIGAALRSRTVRYDDHKARSEFNPETFELVELEQESSE